TDSGAWAQQAYLKASNTGAGDRFGFTLDLSDAGDILVVGAPFEDSDAGGVFQTLPHGVEDNDTAGDSGAAYVFVRDGDAIWNQQAYVKASNTEAGDGFGTAVAVSGAGDFLAVGAPQEDGNGGLETDNSADASGAAYVYARSGATWSQQAYVKASNAEAGDAFAQALALSADGATLAVGAPLEDGNASGGEGDNSADDSGAAYVYARSGATWAQEAYVKAANAAGVPDAVGGDGFGSAVALSGDGATLAVGAPFEDSAALSVDGEAADDCNTIVLINCAEESGAVYVYARSGAVWAPQAYVKASNADVGDLFGQVVRLSANGDMLAVGAVQEDSQTTGVGGTQSDNAANDSGALYLYARDGTDWSDLVYVKGSTTGEDDNFGHALDLSSDGTTLVASAPFEDGNATGVGGEVGEEQDDDSATDAGAVYLF
ncbi:MAG: FG-GAP repeat protein, partial [Gammaproteobacteria bacterium]|nr:FG-GAP repeat protein [Gammaproteobacteria bacterium]